MSLIIDDPLKLYGFEYDFAGQRHGFAVRSRSEAEAMEHARAMAAFRFMGELKPIDTPHSDSAARG